MITFSSEYSSEDMVVNIWLDRAFSNPEDRMKYMKKHKVSIQM